MEYRRRPLGDPGTRRPRCRSRDCGTIDRVQVRRNRRAVSDDRETPRGPVAVVQCAGSAGVDEVDRAMHIHAECRG